MIIALTEGDEFTRRAVYGLRAVPLDEKLFLDHQCADASNGVTVMAVVAVIVFVEALAAHGRVHIAKTPAGPQGLATDQKGFQQRLLDISGKVDISGKRRGLAPNEGVGAVGQVAIDQRPTSALMRSPSPSAAPTF